MTFFRNIWARLTGAFKPSAPRILVVDDDLEIRSLVKDILETRGYYVEIAADGLQGLAKYKQGAYDLLIIDSRMPRIDGNAMLDAIRSLPGGADQAVIMLSAENMLGPIGKSYELGIRDWIPKPFTAKTLLMKVDAHLNAAEKSRPR
jgi:two-component system response regulator VanR